MEPLSLPLSLIYNVVKHIMCNAYRISSRNPCLSCHGTLVFPVTEPLSFLSRNPCLSCHRTLVFLVTEPLSFLSQNPGVQRNPLSETLVSIAFNYSVH